MMTLTTTAFENGQGIPATYTCDGTDAMPNLTIAGVPKGAKSLAIIMNDPDSPSGTWTHWTIWNIPPNTTELLEGKLPQGAVEGKTSFGKTGYGGPCPGKGEHRYFFTLYALDTMLTISADADVDVVTHARDGHIMEKTDVMGTYERKK
ncbi:MAG TPA: YbhB/YbcL family Raf kinase inhibitor-like protein [Candidatus Andersenbacteria bacterium]|nr:YbhB/YbcL family Raf kinase inhibitor-like protein [Candidatus Andersenbacteria bacterium]